MSRKRITQILPFLLPIRVMQRKMFFYTAMRFDNRHYAKTVYETQFPYKLFESNSVLYNSNTGFGMIYQENKVFNLKLAAKKLNGLIIKPGETFSFWQAVHRADKHIPYKEGLTVMNGKLVTSPGGGLCQMSNLLFWVFLHSPLTIIERHTHKVKEFPGLRGDEPEGVDATVNEGWLDLKVKNETDMTFQISIAFSEDNMYCGLYANIDMPYKYEIDGKNLMYFRENDEIYQKIAIYRRKIPCDIREEISESLLYVNICKIGYQIPDDIYIMKGV